MLKMFRTKVRVFLKWETDFLTPLEDFVYSKHKNLDDKSCDHQYIFQDLACDQ